jgi:hypothetical protein
LTGWSAISGGLLALPGRRRLHGPIKPQLEVAWPTPRLETDSCPFSVTRAGSVTTSDPNAASCLRLIGALAVEMHENWLESRHYLNMNDVREHK